MQTFKASLDQKDFAVTGQLRLHQDDTADDVVRQAERLVDVVDAVSVTDCPYGVLHMSGVAVAALLIPRGIDPVLQFSARDRNRIALKSELLGASALGVTSFLLQRGDKLPDEIQPVRKQVFDTGAKRFLATAKSLSDSREARGLPALNLGTMATLFNPEDDWEPRELIAKVDAGANFIQTQICLDPDLLRRWLSFLIEARVLHNSRLIVSIPVLSSAENARWLHKNLRGSVVPDAVVDGFFGAADGKRHGIEVAAGLIAAIRDIPGVCGVNLSTTGSADAIVEAVRLAS